MNIEGLEECVLCGAIVRDPGLHRAWHTEQNNTSYQQARAIEGIRNTSGPYTGR